MSDRITLVTSWVYKQDGSKPREMADMEGVREVVNRLEFLEAENESLRKDAGQWRALVGRAQDPVIGYTGCVICGSADHGGWSCQNYPGGKS